MTATGRACPPDSTETYTGDFDVVSTQGQWAVVHRPSGMVAPADMTCSWLDWAEGKVALAYYPSRRKAQGWFDRITQAAESAALQAAAEPGRLRRMAESERYPSWCIMHRRPVQWTPAPGWWIHTGRNETCRGMWNARAPEGRLEESSDET